MANVVVNIVFKRNGTLSVNPFRATIKYNKLDGSADDVVKWVSKDAPATILFNKNGSPFSGITSIAVPATAAGATSPAPVRTKKTYLYTLTIQPVDGPPITIDPEVDADSDSPPPRRRGRRKK